jgi:hypothetical protein
MFQFGTRVPPIGNQPGRPADRQSRRACPSFLGSRYPLQVLAPEAWAAGFPLLSLTRVFQSDRHRGQKYRVAFTNKKMNQEVPGGWYRKNIPFIGLTVQFKF